MFNMKGQKCPYCGEAFADRDDIVVCPECGTPHHRDCYMQHRQCANHALHGTGFEWKPETPAKPAPDDGMVCPQCGHNNPSLSLFCNNCGFSLQDMPRQPDGTDAVFSERPLYGQSPYEQQRYGQQPYGRMPDGPEQTQHDGYGSAGVPYMRGGYRRTVDSNTEFDGIPAKQWVEYIGVSSAPYYLASFVYQNEYNKKTGFVWSAAIAPYLYFAYRRVWWAAVTTLLLAVALAMPGTVVMLSQYGMLNLNLTVSQLNALVNVSNVCSVVYMAIRLLSGVFAVYLFRRDAARRIKARMQMGDGRIPSGPSTLGVVLIVAAFMALTMLAGTMLTRIFTVAL